MAEKRKKRFRDRKDGRWLRTLPSYNAMMPYIMKTKNDANILMSEAVEISETERFLRQKKNNGFPGIGMLHLFIAAYIRTAAQYPAINRFISGQRVYSRNNIEMIMTIKKEMKIDAEETSIKMTFDPRDTINDVYRKLSEEVEKVRGGSGDTEADDLSAMFMKLPRLILKAAICFINFLDYFGKVPYSLIKASPFHGSMIITDLGSIGLPAVYHHLYNFGNIPVFVGIGAKRKSLELKPDGGIIERKYLEFKLVMDERVSDGFYYSQAVKLFKSYLRKPHVLETPPETVLEDID